MGCHCLLRLLGYEAKTPVIWSFDTNSQLIRKVPEAGKDGGEKEKRVSEDELA